MHVTVLTTLLRIMEDHRPARDIQYVVPLASSDPGAHFCELTVSGRLLWRSTEIQEVLIQGQGLLGHRGSLKAVGWVGFHPTRNSPVAFEKPLKQCGLHVPISKIRRWGRMSSPWSSEGIPLCTGGMETGGHVLMPDLLGSHRRGKGSVRNPWCLKQTC